MPKKRESHSGQQDVLLPQDKVLMEQYRIVHAARLQLEDRICSVGNAAMESTDASDELQSTIQKPAQDVTDSSAAKRIRQFPDLQNLLADVRELISLSMQLTAEMVIKTDTLGNVELALIAQMSETAQKEIEYELKNPNKSGKKPVRRTDCWIKTSRGKKKRKK